MPATACQAHNKQGQPCKRPASPSGYCKSHDPAIPASERFGTPEQAAAAAELAVEAKAEIAAQRRMGLMERLRREVEDRQEDVLWPYFEALKQTRARIEKALKADKPVSTSDLDLAMRASERLLDRAIGKPMQAVELGGSGGGPVEVREAAGMLDDDELDRQLKAFQAGISAQKTAARREAKAPANSPAGGAA